METPSKDKSRSYGERKIPVKLPRLHGVVFGKIVGEGFFSHVYNGTYHDKPAAIKLVERGNSNGHLKEIEFLKKLHGVPDIVQLYSVFEADNTFIVFELLESCTPAYFYENTTIPRLRHYIKHVLNALKGAHSQNIVHRDVKFSNILVSPTWDRISLIDWGCASYISESMSSCAGSRVTRSPEMLLGYKGYKTGCDAWAVGTLIIDILTEGKVPWKKESTQETLISLTHYFGAEALIRIAGRYCLPLDPNLLSKMTKDPIRNLETKFTERMQPIWTKKLRKLTLGLLQIDPEKRLSVEKAMKARYFFKRRKITRELYPVTLTFD